MLIWILASCTEGTDFDINYTPIAPIGGQYVVTVSYGFDKTKSDVEFWADPTNVKDSLQIYAYLSNTTFFDTDSAWVRIGSYSARNGYNINTKVFIDMSNYSFSGLNINNFVGNSITPVDSVTINGFCTHNNFVAPSGATTDYISFIYSRTDLPGYHWKVEGWKYTGWAEDDY